MQVLNLTNVYTLKHVFSPSHLPTLHLNEKDRIETEFVESMFIHNPNFYKLYNYYVHKEQHSILLLPETIQSVGPSFLEKISDFNSSLTSIPFLFYKFRTNRGLTGHVVYNILQHKKGLPNSQPKTKQEKKKEDRLVTVRMIDVSDSSIFLSEKYAVSGSALACSLGKHAQLFSDNYIANARKEIGKVEEIGPKIPNLPSESNFASSCEINGSKEELESLDDWIQDNFLKETSQFDYLKVLRHRMLKIGSKLSSGKKGVPASLTTNKESMNIVRKLGYSSMMRIDVCLEVSKVMEMEIMNEILMDLQTQREIPRSEILQFENSLDKETKIILKDQPLFRIEGFKHSSYSVLDSNGNRLGVISPKVTLSSKFLLIHVKNHKNELRYVIRNDNTTTNRIFTIEDMTPKIAYSVGAVPTSQSNRITQKSGRIIKQATGFSNELTAHLKNMVIDFPPLCQPVDQVLLFGSMLVLELEYNMSRKQLECSHPSLLY